jgi:predicted phosphodiesterase
MRYLILTDIHANIDALEATDEPYDELLVLGDLVDYGAAPEETVRWIRDRNPIAVSGNHDYAMATGADCRSSPISYALSVYGVLNGCWRGVILKIERNHDGWPLFFRRKPSVYGRRSIARWLLVRCLSIACSKTPRET